MTSSRADWSPGSILSNLCSSPFIISFILIPQSRQGEKQSPQNDPPVDRILVNRRESRLPPHYRIKAIRNPEAHSILKPNSERPNLLRIAIPFRVFHLRLRPLLRVFLIQLRSLDKRDWGLLLLLCILASWILFFRETGLEALDFGHWGLNWRGCFWVVPW